MKETVLDTIRKYNLVLPGDKVVVGVSGGPDSACLLHLLSSFSNDLCIKLYAVHINHMLRGEESLRDQHYVEELCDSRNIPFFCACVDVRSISKEKGISIEEAGREARYAIFESYADRVGARCIAVAHNRSDQAETVLMNIIRGSGLDGLTGMDYKRGRIIRPLLGISRAKIEQYCKENGLKPVTDSSNLKNIYTRNKVRLDLIPSIDSTFGANIVDTLWRMSAIIRDEAAFIDEQAEAAYKSCICENTQQSISLSLNCLVSVHPAIAKRVLRLAVYELNGSLKGIGSVHIENLYELAVNGRTGAAACLPGGIRAARGYLVLDITTGFTASEDADFTYMLNIPGTTVVKVPDLHSGKQAEASFECSITNADASGMGIFMNNKSQYVQFFDYEKIKQGIDIRNRRKGDIYKPIGSTGGKKLKEYMIDHKIPRQQRGKIMFLASGSEIVWIVGSKISDKFKVTENTKSMLRVEFRMLVSNKENKQAD